MLLWIVPDRRASQCSGRICVSFRGRRERGCLEDLLFVTHILLNTIKQTSYQGQPIGYSFYSLLVAKQHEVLGLSLCLSLLYLYITGHQYWESQYHCVCVHNQVANVGIISGVSSRILMQWKAKMIYWMSKSTSRLRIATIWPLLHKFCPLWVSVPSFGYLSSLSQIWML